MTLHPFQAHLELLQFFLTHRNDVVERIQGVLSAQRKPVDYLHDGRLLSRQFEDCLFIGASHDHARLRGQLEEAHWASGFEPRELPGLHNGLAEPAEMMIRAFHLWQQTRWPGRNGRVRYAHTLFNLYVLRALTLLTMRLWDDDSSRAGARLAQLQDVLDALWKTSPADQPVLVRDVRWLIPMAQSPATDDLGPYFDVAARVAESLSDADRIDIHSAGARLTGGHLRSQIRYHSLKKGVSLDDASLVLSTRNSNALDFALLIEDLVPLLEAYARACDGDDRTMRLALADAICQGISPDPGLFLDRVELLGAYSMIEHLFITTDDDGHAAYSPVGRRHVQLFETYKALISRLAHALHDDCAHFRPVAGAYSPYGVLYGFASNLIEHMAFKTLQTDAVTRFGLEDIFVGGDSRKLEWVSGWRKLPHLTREVQAQFDYPQRFAEDVFDRIEHALHRRVSNGETTVQTGRLVVVPDGDSEERYLRPTDEHDRREGRCLVSYQTPTGWMAISKDVLTDVLGAGRDVTLAGLPPEAVGVLTLMCPNLVRPPDLTVPDRFDTPGTD